MDNDELKTLIDRYQPSAETVAAMRKVSLLATVGPSATGKSTIMRALSESNRRFHFVVGETSRTARANEQNGADLFFRSREAILADLQAGRLTQVVVGPNGDLYCTRVENFPTGKISLFPLVPKGVVQFRALPLKFFAAAFIVPAGFELWQQWLAKQAELSGWSQEKLVGRLHEALASHEFALSDPQIRFVLNDNVPKAAERLAQVAGGQAPEREEGARRQALINYQKLKELIRG